MQYWIATLIDSLISDNAFNNLGYLLHKRRKRDIKLPHISGITIFIYLPAVREISSMEHGLTAIGGKARANFKGLIHHGLTRSFYRITFVVRQNWRKDIQLTVLIYKVEDGILLRIRWQALIFIACYTDSRLTSSQVIFHLWIITIRNWGSRSSDKQVPRILFRVIAYKATKMVSYLVVVCLFVRRGVWRTPKTILHA